MSDVCRTFSPSAEVTHRLAAALAPHLRAGDALCLVGDLGAGKTTFVHGLVRALGSRDDVLSPTFTLENRYAVNVPSGPTEVVHADLYRCGEEVDAELAGSLLEAREDGALLAVEWGAPLATVLAPYLEIEFAVGDNAGRRIALRPVPAGWPAVAAVREEWDRIGERIA